MTSIECVNPGTGDATFLKKHKQLVARIEGTPIRLETWRFKESICGGYMYRLTGPDLSALKKIVSDLQFPSFTSCEKGELVDNKTCRSANDPDPKEKF